MSVPKTDREKLESILKALRFPEGQYVIHADAAHVILGKMSETNNLPMSVSTALFFGLLESIEAGLIWGLWLPDPEDEEQRCDSPVLFVTLLGIEVRCSFGATGELRSAAEEIQLARMIDGWPIACGAFT